MSRSTHLKPGHKAIQQYHAALKTYSGQHVEHEGALESAFQRLLADRARDLKAWTLIPKLKLKVRGRTIFPDGALRDEFNLPRGYWEAKDTHDDLDAEIGKKIEKGYPLGNISFEDNRRFQAAFDDFFAMCQTALNPNLSRDAVDERLVQHLLIAGDA